MFHSPSTNFETMSNKSLRATAAARQWVSDKGWVEDDYRVVMSQVQSAPLGCVSVDVLCIRHEDADDARQLLQRSRVLELNAGRPVPTLPAASVCVRALVMLLGWPCALHALSLPPPLPLSSAHDAGLGFGV